MWIHYQGWGLFWIDAWQPVGNCLTFWGYRTDPLFYEAFELRIPPYIEPHGTVQPTPQDSSVRP